MMDQMVIYWYCTDTMASTVLTLENYKYTTSLYYVHNFVFLGIDRYAYTYRIEIKIIRPVSVLILAEFLFW